MKKIDKSASRSNLITYGIVIALLSSIMPGAHRHGTC